MSRNLVRVARDLRLSSTDAERCLWFRLRGGRLQHAKFRRQHPIVGYVVDFVCIESRLIVELDGSQHMDREAMRDLRRTQVLRAHGYRVLRFWNNDVLRNTDAVLQRIAEALDPSPPAPLPASGARGARQR